ncbi:hypothetical protein EC973_003118 [Apophysomyces ossiformis]|uniref:Uncharacterized protein n=1 Tax=Apophysomyces ossiformis TaxID=679940 RepID=A0A8H7EMH4_9FUNG|nr:hypothetical protein EC973_003118 [Apophysomyces ossiformis]
MDIGRLHKHHDTVNEPFLPINNHDEEHTVEEKLAWAQRVKQHFTVRANMHYMMKWYLYVILFAIVLLVLEYGYYRLLDGNSENRFIDVGWRVLVGSTVFLGSIGVDEFLCGRYIDGGVQLLLAGTAAGNLFWLLRVFQAISFYDTQSVLLISLVVSLICA